MALRVRKLDSAGDMTFGGGASAYFRDQPEAPAQIILTRLRLILGEWFLDTTDGTDWNGKVLGKHTRPTWDHEIRARILTTPHVTGITVYGSRLDRRTRTLTIRASVTTDFGPVTFILAPSGSGAAAATTAVSDDAGVAITDDVGAFIAST